MAQLTHKSGVGEKGQRAPRSMDLYLPRKGMKEAAFCSSCGALYRGKRWSLDDEAVKEARTENRLNRVICPACRRVADNNPAGVVTLAGEYLRGHRVDILNAIRQIEARSRTKNPLGRIMAIDEGQDSLTITTTEDKLAQKLGRELFKAHRGELHYRWNHEEHFVRVTWSR